MHLMLLIVLCANSNSLLKTHGIPLEGSQNTSKTEIRTTEGNNLHHKLNPVKIKREEPDDEEDLNVEFRLAEEGEEKNLVLKLDFRSVLNGTNSTKTAKSMLYYNKWDFCESNDSEEDEDEKEGEFKDSDLWLTVILWTIIGKILISLQVFINEINRVDDDFGKCQYCFRTMTATFIIIIFLLPLLNGIPIGSKDFILSSTQTDAKRLDNNSNLNVSKQSYGDKVLDENLENGRVKRQREEDVDKIFEEDYETKGERRAIKNPHLETTKSTEAPSDLKKNPKLESRDDDDKDIIETTLEPDEGNQTTEAEEMYEDEVPPSNEQYSTIDIKLNVTAFLIGALITALCFCLLTSALCFIMRPTGRCCDNFLRKPGQPSYSKRRKEEKIAAREDAKKTAKEKREKKRKQADWKFKRAMMAKEDKQIGKEGEKMKKQSVEEQKERLKQRKLAHKEREKAKKEAEKERLAQKEIRQKEAIEEKREMLKEKQEKDEEALAKAREELKKREADLKANRKNTVETRRVDVRVQKERHLKKKRSPPSIAPVLEPVQLRETSSNSETSSEESTDSIPRRAQSDKRKKFHGRGEEI